MPDLKLIQNYLYPITRYLYILEEFPIIELQKLEREEIIFFLKYSYERYIIQPIQDTYKILTLHKIEEINKEKNCILASAVTGPKINMFSISLKNQDIKDKLIITLDKILNENLYNSIEFFPP